MFGDIYKIRLINRLGFFSLAAVLMVSCALYSLKDEDIAKVQFRANALKESIISLESDSNLASDQHKVAYRGFLAQAKLLMQDLEALPHNPNEVDKWKGFGKIHAEGVSLYLRIKTYVEITRDTIHPLTLNKLKVADKAAVQLNQAWLDVLNEKKNIRPADVALLLLDFSDVILGILIDMKFPDGLPAGNHVMGDVPPLPLHPADLSGIRGWNGYNSEDKSWRI